MRLSHQFAQLFSSSLLAYYHKTKNARLKNATDLLHKNIMKPLLIGQTVIIILLTNNHQLFLTINWLTRSLAISTAMLATCSWSPYVEMSFCMTPVRSSFSVSRITFNSSGKCEETTHVEMLSKWDTCTSQCGSTGKMGIKGFEDMASYILIIRWLNLSHLLDRK